MNNIDDTISRAKAIEALVAETIYTEEELKEYYEANSHRNEWVNGIHEAVEVIKQLPPAQLSTNLAEVGTDTISRQAAIDALDEQIEQCNKSLSSFDISMKDEYAVKVERASLVAFRETLEYLPPAQPAPSQVAKDIARIVENGQDMRVIGQERIRGHWIIRETSSGDTEARCSHCGFTTLVDEPGNGLHMVSDLNFCPNCGADMREVMK